MKTRVFANPAALGRAAAAHVADVLRAAIRERGKARVLASARKSDAGFLTSLQHEPDVAWREVELFHLEEFIGLGADHPGSSRKYLYERLIQPTGMGRYHLLEGQHEPDRTCREEGDELRAGPVDVAWMLLGENGRLAFNEPPADFSTETPYGIMRLEDGSRRELVREGRFPSTQEVPDRAISISIRQLLKTTTILCLAPGHHRAEAVKRCVEGSVSPLAPASILQTHPNATMYLDCESARLLAARSPLES